MSVKCDLTILNNYLTHFVCVLRTIGLKNSVSCGYDIFTGSPVFCLWDVISELLKMEVTSAGAGCYKPKGAACDSFSSLLEGGLPEPAGNNRKKLIGGFAGISCI